MAKVFDMSMGREIPDWKSLAFESQTIASQAADEYTKLALQRIDDLIMASNGQPPESPFSLGPKGKIQWAKNTYHNRLRTTLCPECLGSGQVERHQNYSEITICCPTCDGHKKISASYLHALREAVIEADNMAESVTHWVELTGLPPHVGTRVLGQPMGQSAAAILKNLIAAQQLAKQAQQQAENNAMGFIPPSGPVVPAINPADTRPVILSWSLHTLLGKPVLKLNARGARTYPQDCLIGNTDFQPGADNQHKFSGKLTKRVVDLEGSEVVQRLEIELSQHAMIDSGQYKPKTVVTSQGKAQPIGVITPGGQAFTTMGAVSTIPSKQPSLPPASQPAEPGFIGNRKRKFNLG